MVATGVLDKGFGADSCLMNVPSPFYFLPELGTRIYHPKLVVGLFSSI
jgi:hypothetical protein